MDVQPLPVGVLVPVLNCRSELPRHLERMAEWLDRVREVVVVDSQSTDGTADFLRDNLRHPNLRILDHPPGLYPSWNHGIAALESEYFFVATLGDGMSRAGLERMHATAEELETDVLVGLPKLVDESGKPTGQQWPLHDMVADLGWTGAEKIDGWTWLAWAMMHLPATLIGSSASNLYRTRFMQERPFSSDYSRMGDSAWALEHAFSARLGVEPRAESIFWVHSPPDGIHQRYADVIGSFVELVERVVEREMASGNPPPDPVREIFREFEAKRKGLIDYFVSAAEYRRLKKEGGSFWRAFRIRMRRRRFHRWRKGFRQWGREKLQAAEGTR